MSNALLWVTALGLEVCLAILASTADAGAIPLQIGLLMTSVLLYTFSAHLVARETPDLHKKVVLSLAILYRLTLIGAQPALSDDVLRYRWEGAVQVEQGGNPYLMRPEDRRIPGAGFRSGYGPLTTLIEAGTYRAAAAITADPRAQAFWMKAPAVAFELMTLGLLAGLPVRQLVWYAWSPLPVVEFWWNGHNDALPVLCILIAALAARRERWTHALLAIGVGVAAKWWPAMLAPALVWHAGFSWRRVCRWPLLVLPAAAAAIPFLTVPVGVFIENARFMSGFVGGWRNNDSIFGLLLWATGDAYRAKYLAFALIAAAVLWMLRWPVERAMLGVIAVVLLISANCHPWYLTWFTPLLVWVRWPPLFVWQALMPMAYLVLVDWRTRGVWDGSTAARWWIWGPVYASMAVWGCLRASRVGSPRDRLS
ncbi:MAG: hypothetical protein R2762_11025 [Bryobacteraceae bacterium]